MKPHRLLGQLAQVRRAGGRPQAEVAADLHVCRMTVSYWENGRRQPSLEDLDRLAALYGYRLVLIPQGYRVVLEPLQLREVAA